MYSVDQLLNQIPPSMEYSFTVQRLGFHYSCYLKIINGKQTVRFTGSSNDLSVALELLAQKVSSFRDSTLLQATA